MKILYIHQYFSTREGSTGTRSYEFGRRWAAQGHDVEVLTSTSALPRHLATRPEPFELESMTVHAVDVPYSNRMSAAWRIWAYVAFALRALGRARRIDRPEIVLATSTPLTVGIPGVLLSRYFRCPLVFEVRDLWPEAPIELGWLRPAPLRWLAWALARWIYSHSAQVVTLSPGMREGVLRNGVDPTKVSMIPNCSDNDLFRPDGCRPELRARFGIDGMLALYAGALGAANRVSDLLYVCERLREMEAEVTIVVIGRGREEAALRRGVEERGLDNLRILGPLPKLEVRDWVAACDLGMVLFDRQPILQLTSPNKFFDLCAGGRATLINIGGWIADLIEEEGIGITVRDGDPERIASTLLDTSADPTELRAMGRRARQVAVRRFDRNLLSQEMLQVLHDAARE